MQPVPFLEGLQDRMRVRVSALFPSKQCTSSGKPAASTMSPIWICGSTRRSLLIPTLRSWSSFSISKYNVVQSYRTNDTCPAGVLAECARQAVATLPR